MLGQMDASALEAEIVDVTPARCENHDVSAGPDSADLSMVPVRISVALFDCTCSVSLSHSSSSVCLKKGAQVCIWCREYWLGALMPLICSARDHVAFQQGLLKATEFAQDAAAWSQKFDWQLMLTPS